MPDSSRVLALLEVLTHSLRVIDEDRQHAGCVQALREKQDEITAAKREVKELEDSLVRR